MQTLKNYKENLNCDGIQYTNSKTGMSIIQHNNNYYVLSWQNQGQNKAGQEIVSFSFFKFGATFGRWDITKELNHPNYNPNKNNIKTKKDDLMYLIQFYCLDYIEKDN